MAALLLCGSAALSQKPADRETFETVCGACHPSGMVSDFRSEPEWRDVVAEMVKNGAKGTEEQLTAVVRYLLENWTKVNVNTASAAEIAPVLGVNESTAQAIVKRRTEKGGFRNIDELKQLPGVDAARMEERKERIVFGKDGQP
jgi:competence protein ComEA